MSDTISLSNDDLLPAGDNILITTRTFIHKIEDTEIVDEAGKSAQNNTTGTGITAHKGNTTTNIQAPVGSSLLIMGLRFRGNGGGGGVFGTFAIRGTSTADSFGSSADDISKTFQITGNPQILFSTPLILPADRFLTVVKTAFTINDSAVTGEIDELIVIGSEAF